MSRNPRTGRVSRSGVHKIARYLALRERGKSLLPVVRWFQRWSGGAK